MARTALSVQTITRAGITPSYSAANADGHSIQNSEANFILHVKNGSGSSITVTIATAAQIDGLDVSDRTVTVGAGAEKVIGTFPQSIYNQSDGTVNVDFSAVTSVTVAAFKVI